MKVFNFVATFAVALLLTAWTASATASTVTYTFEGLSQAALPGQDGWVGGSASVSTGTGVNTTQVADLTGTSVTLDRLSNAVPFLISYDASDTDATLQFDVRNTDSDRAVVFLDGTAASPWIGVDGTGFSYRANAVAGGLDSAPLSGAGANSDNTDWYRIRASFNFVTGLADVFATNLTEGNAEALIFDDVAIPNAANAATWNTVRVRADGAADAGARVIDNIVVQGVPEPASLLLAGFGCLAMLSCRRHG